MKQILLIIASALLLLVALIFVFREPLTDSVYDWATRDMFIPADTDSFDPGPSVDQPFPPIHARYQGQVISDVSRFAGPNGTLVIASRSMDWCPYCMRQMIQLQEYKQGFDKAGIGMVGITYDTPEQQQRFIDKHGITIPLLSDIDTTTFATLDILNEQYSPGDMAYGIPHPGLFVIDTAGNVAGKLFIEGYSTRVHSAAALDFAMEVLAIPTANPL
jgi:peroxiredoxin